MFEKIDLPTSLRAAVAAQIAKGGYKLPAMRSFSIEDYGTTGAALYAGNM
jgi:hypothetical protein